MQVQAKGQTNWGTPERAALTSAACGFAISFIFLAIRGVSTELQTSSAYAPTSIDAALVFLWPSSVLLWGAQSVQGKIVLFLLSAFLNAGYYTFVALSVCGILEKFRSRNLVSVKVVAEEHRAHPATGIADRMSATRSVI